MTRKRKPKQRPTASRQQVKAERYEGEAARDEPRAQDNSLAPAAPAVAVRQVETPEAVDRASRRDKKTKQPQQSGDRWMTRFTGLILFVTAVSSGAAFLQWRSTERSIDVGNRAYVGVKEVQLSNTVLSGQPMSAAAIIENAGETPAKNYRAKICGSFGPSIPDPKGTCPIQRTGPRDLTDVGVLMPGGGAVVKLPPFIPTEQQRAIALSPDGRFYVYGVIEYDDMFGQHHETTYCFVNESPDSNKFWGCNRGNSIN